MDNFKRWRKSLSRLESETHNALKNKVLNNSGNPRDNATIVRVNAACQEALNALDGIED